MNDAQQAPEPTAWLELDEAERVALCEEQHRKPPKWHPPFPNEKVHAAMHVAVENQLAMRDPPEARQALVRLMSSGLDRHEALHAVAACLSRGMFKALREQRFDADEYKQSLQNLTVESWRGSAD